MANYHISLNDELAEIVELEMKRGRYANRSEFFRNLVRKHCIIKGLIPDKINMPGLDCELI